MRAHCTTCGHCDRWAAEFTEILITPHSCTWWAWCPKCEESFHLPVAQENIDALVGEGVLVLDWSGLRPDTPPRRMTPDDAELLARIDRMPRRALRRRLGDAAEQILRRAGR